MKILLLGANGQVGQAFQDLAKTDAFPIGWELIAFGHKDADLTKIQELLVKIDALKPDVIVNAAAYTAVDQAEVESELCTQINAAAPKALAAFAKSKRMVLVHFSSDYVYDGEAPEIHVETETLAPANQYARSKALGDQAIVNEQGEYLIFRTSWVYSITGRNFVKTMLNLGQNKSELKVVNDQVGSPTYAPDLAMYTLQALMRALETKSVGLEFPSGVYHVCNSGFTTWADFAKAILPKVNVVGIPTREYPTPAKRPHNSKLSL